MSDDWLEFVRDPNPWTPPDPAPAPVVTPRTVVRLWQKGDGPGLYSAIEANRPALLPFMVWALTDHRHVEDSIHYVESVRRRATSNDCTDFGMGIFDRETGEVLGGTGFIRIRAGAREAEVGYWVRGDRQGHGYCTEAIGALISSGLAPGGSGWGFRRIVVYNSTLNVASKRVCEKLGLRLEARLRKDRFLGPSGAHGPAGYQDTLGFAVLEDEWDFVTHRAKPDIAWPREE
jgi:RimJ/RimL family protein N-acetyltransferase